MFKSPYDTTICRQFNMKNTINKLQEAYITSGQIKMPTRTDGTVIEVPEVNVIVPGHADVPLFTHPITIETPSKKDVTIVDVRGFTRLTRDGTVQITSVLDYEFNVLRGILQSRWEDPDNFTDLANLGIIPMRMFTQWLNNVITIRLGIDASVQVRVSVLAAYFYACQFIEIDKGELEESVKMRIASQISRATYTDTNMVFGILDEVGTITNVDEFIYALGKFTNSVRFENFNAAFLYTIISSSWFGANKNEILAVALEHPPTWISLAFIALTEKGYQNTQIGKLMYKVKSDEIDYFTKSIAGIISLAGNR